MLALEPIIVERLAADPGLSGWTIAGSLDNVSRATLPRIDVRVGASIRAAGSRTAAQLAPDVDVMLITERTQAGAEHLDAAIPVVIAALQNWSPGNVCNRQWSPLVAVNSSMDPAMDEHQLSIALVFSTAATYHGQP